MPAPRGSPFAVFLGLTFVAWRRYLWVARAPRAPEDTCPYSLTDVFGGRRPGNAPHQEGVRWLTEIFSRSAARFPDLTALQIPHTGESLTFAELDARAEAVAAALSPWLTGPDQVVAVAMAQDNWQIVAAHLGILKAGGTVMFLDTTLPDALVATCSRTPGRWSSSRAGRPASAACRRSTSWRSRRSRSAESRRPGWTTRRAPRHHLLHERNHRDAQGSGVPARRLREPRADLRGLLRSRSGHGRHLAHFVPGLRRQHLRDVQRLGVGLRRGAADQGADPVRPGPRPRPARGRGHRALLSAGPPDHPHADPRAGSPLPDLPLRRSGRRGLPPALVEPWTRGRRQIINTYGPTEASTDTSRQSLRPGEPVTIGSPFPNVTYVILEVGGLRPLPHGEEGELCIGGVHLARGYRNLPERPPRSSSPTPASAASTAPATAAGSTSGRSGCTSSAASTRSSRCAGTGSRSSRWRTSSRRSSGRSRRRCWTTRTRSSSPSSPRRRSARVRPRPSLRRRRSGPPGSRRAWRDSFPRRRSRRGSSWSSGSS